VRARAQISTYDRILLGLYDFPTLIHDVQTKYLTLRLVDFSVKELGVSMVGSHSISNGSNAKEGHREETTEI
jgi:hypothetical protein